MSTVSFALLGPLAVDSAPCRTNWARAATISWLPSADSAKCFPALPSAFSNGPTHRLDHLDPAVRLLNTPPMVVNGDASPSWLSRLPYIAAFVAVQAAAGHIGFGVSSCAARATVVRAAS